MNHSVSQKSAPVWRLLFASGAPLVLLSAYLFVFRWPDRVFVTQGDYLAAIMCALSGAIVMAVQPAQLWHRLIGIGFHIGMSSAVFALWLVLGRPALGDPII